MRCTPGYRQPYRAETSKRLPGPVKARPPRDGFRLAGNPPLLVPSAEEWRTSSQGRLGEKKSRGDGRLPLGCVVVVPVWRCVCVSPFDPTGLTSLAELSGETNEEAEENKQAPQADLCGSVDVFLNTANRFRRTWNGLQEKKDLSRSARRGVEVRNKPARQVKRSVGAFPLKKTHRWRNVKPRIGSRDWI